MLIDQEGEYQSLFLLLDLDGDDLLVDPYRWCCWVCRFPVPPCGGNDDDDDDDAEDVFDVVERDVDGTANELGCIYVPLEGCCWPRCL
jgi:hypothetical protein